MARLQDEQGVSEAPESKDGWEVVAFPRWVRPALLVCAAGVGFTLADYRYGQAFATAVFFGGLAVWAVRLFLGWWLSHKDYADFKAARDRGLRAIRRHVNGRAKMHQYRDESDDIRVTKTVRVARSNVPIDVDGLKRRISEKIDAEIQTWAKEYFGYGGDNT